MSAPDDPAVAPSTDEPRARIGTALGVVIVVIAIVLAVSFWVERGDDEARVAREVVALHELPPELAPPPPGTAEPPGFAANAAADGWVRIGTREDRLEGRDTETTYWQKAGSRVAYTTVSGGPVEIPQTGLQTGRRGLLLRGFDEDGRTAVAWNEDGHTVVISGIRISRASLYNLAGGPAGADVRGSG